MNASIPALQVIVAAPPKAPSVNESAQPASQPADSNKSASQTSDFAGTLNRVSAKPARKSDEKHAAGKKSGADLPPAGSTSPPPAQAVPAAPALAADGSD